MPAPIILFVYNRPEHTRRTITSLQGCDLARESHLFVFADGPKSPADATNVQAVRQLLQSVEGFAGVTVAAREANQGLARSVIGGVTEVLRALLDGVPPDGGRLALALAWCAVIAGGGYLWALRGYERQARR